MYFFGESLQPQIVIFIFHETLVPVNGKNYWR